MSTTMEEEFKRNTQLVLDVLQVRTVQTWPWAVSHQNSGWPWPRDSTSAPLNSGEISIAILIQRQVAPDLPGFFRIESPKTKKSQQAEAFGIFLVARGGTEPG